MMNEQYWEIVEYECQDGKCLMIHNIPNDSKLGALSLDHKNIGEAIVEKLNEQQATIEEYKDFCLNLCKFLIQKDFVDEYREKYGKEYKIITKWW